MDEIKPALHTAIVTFVYAEDGIQNLGGFPITNDEVYLIGANVSRTL
jgi:hypothetical protein